MEGQIMSYGNLEVRGENQAKESNPQDSRSPTGSGCVITGAQQDLRLGKQAGAGWRMALNATPRSWHSKLWGMRNAMGRKDGMRVGVGGETGSGAQCGPDTGVQGRR